MCDLRTVSDKQNIEGYKVVARKSKGKRYYSVAMGFKYPLDGHIPAVRRQQRISSGYKDEILEKYSAAYRKDMIGRTAIFLSLADVREEYKYLSWRNLERGYKMIAIRVVVSQDIMEGVYGGRRVVAGRHIHFMEEVDINKLIPQEIQM